MGYFRRRWRFLVALAVMLVIDLEITGSLWLVCGPNFFIDQSPGIAFYLVFGAIMAHAFQDDELLGCLFGDLRYNNRIETIIFDILGTPISMPIVLVSGILLIGSIVAMLAYAIFCALFVWKTPEEQQ